MTARKAHRRLYDDERHWGQAPDGALPAQRYVNGRLVRSVGFVDENGMYYSLPQSRVWPVVQAVCLGVILAAAVVFVLPLLVAPPRVMTTQSPLGTADVRPRPTPSPAPPQSEPASVPLFADEPQPTPYDNAAYNATAEAESAPAEVLIVVTPTTLPAPGAPGFEASFAEPVCSPMIDYLRGHPCYGRVGQKPLPQPGSDEFVESFEEPGD